MYTAHELDINSYPQAQNVKEIQVRRENFAVPTLFRSPQSEKVTSWKLCYNHIKSNYLVKIFKYETVLEWIYLI